MYRKQGSWLNSEEDIIRGFGLKDLAAQGLNRIPVDHCSNHQNRDTNPFTGQEPLHQHVLGNFAGSDPYPNISEIAIVHEHSDYRRRSSSS